MQNHKVSDNFTLIACLVTDKKYRKMGGDEGLNGALHGLNLAENTRVLQVPVKEIFENDQVSNETFFKYIMEQCKLSSFKSVKLIHKYSDFSKADELSGTQVNALRAWLISLQTDDVFTVLDAPEDIDVLSNRKETGHLIQEFCLVEGFEGSGLQWPEFSDYKSTVWTKLKLPVIAKPIDACGTDDSHWMSLYRSFNTRFLPKDDSIVQKFYEHYGILYKVYVIGRQVEIVARPSISNRDYEPDTFLHRFNTHKFKLSEGDLSAERLEEAEIRISPLRSLIESFALKLKDRLNLTWFGIDVIIPEEDANNCDENDLVDRNTIKAAVIDINYMPGYDGITNLPEKLIKAVLPDI